MANPNPSPNPNPNPNPHPNPHPHPHLAEQVFPPPRNPLPQNTPAHTPHCHPPHIAEQVSWLDSCTRDAMSAARPLLAAREDLPAASVEEALLAERARWADGSEEMRALVNGLTGVFASLASELHASCLAASAKTSPALRGGQAQVLVTLPL